MGCFRNKFRFFAIATITVIFLYIKSSSSSNIPLSDSGIGTMFSLLLVTSSWKVSYTNPTTIHSTPQEEEKNVGNFTEYYGNNVNLNVSSTGDQESLVEEPPKNYTAVGIRTSRKQRFRVGSKSKPRSKSTSYFHNIKKRKKSNRQGEILDETSDAESLRRKILSQLGSVDPLLCLPKALCGVSSRQKQSQFLSPEGQKGTDDDLNNYLQLMQTVIPPKDENDIKTTTKKKKKKKRKRKSKGPKSGFRYGENDSGSSQSSSSEESNESEELSQDDIEEQEYIREKAEMEKLMTDADYEQDPNWWESVNIPNQGPNSYDLGQTTGGSSMGTSGSSSAGLWPMATGVTRLVRSMMPSMSWGFGKSVDVFGDDPFFKDQKRSISDGRSMSSRWSFGGTDLKTHSNNKKLNHDGKIRYKVLKKRKAQRKKAFLDKRKGEVEQIDDPSEKFELAVEIGKQLDDPQQCEYIFNGCPFSYQEILAIIDSNSSEKSKLSKESNEPQSDDDEGHSTDQYFQSNQNNEIETHPVSRTPVSRGKKRVIKHKMPNGEELEIRLKVSDSINGQVTIPQVSLIPNPNNFHELNADATDDQSSSSASDSESSDINPNPEIEDNHSYLRSDIPGNQSSEESIPNKDKYKDSFTEQVKTSEDLEKGNKKVQRNPSRKAKKSRKKKKSNKNRQVTLPISHSTFPYLFHSPSIPPASPPPHVTNYHYYSANGPTTKYNYEPHPHSHSHPDPPLSKSKKSKKPKKSQNESARLPEQKHKKTNSNSQPQENFEDEFHSHYQPSKYSHSNQPNSKQNDYGYNFHSPSGTKYSHNNYQHGNPEYEHNQQHDQNSQHFHQYQHQQKPQAQNSEERIVIRLPETSNNNYYNMFTNPFGSLGSLTSYSQTPAPSYLPHTPQSFLPSISMYPQMRPHHPQLSTPAGAYPFQSFPNPSMFSYLFGKK